MSVREGFVCPNSKFFTQYLGEYLKYRRIKHPLLTQSELSKIVKISRTSYTAYENSTTIPSIDILFRIACNVYKESFPKFIIEYDKFLCKVDRQIKKHGCYFPGSI